MSLDNMAFALFKEFNAPILVKSITLLVSTLPVNVKLFESCSFVLFVSDFEASLSFLSDTALTLSSDFSTFLSSFLDSDLETLFISSLKEESVDVFFALSDEDAAEL